MGSAISRRGFLVRSAAVAGGSALGASLLQGLAGCGSGAATGLGAGEAPPSADGGGAVRADGRAGYGRLASRAAENTGQALLALPAGFRYTVFGRAGSPLSDGRPTPGAPDGMAAFRGPEGAVRLIRNHELRARTPVSSIGRSSLAYDGGAPGGATTLDVDAQTR
ncbi:MAG TPA: alkaline phosphatase PhoX, partial [Methylomirabilota bacterium]|nr:alkaline phosphatase PhoX [Methylomirabilota bacterium]